MAIRSRIAAYLTQATSHVVTLPGDVQVGDRVIVGFANDQETTDTSPSLGWDKLGEQGQGISTNHSLSVFTRVLDGTADDELTVTLTDDTNSPDQQAAYVAICLVGNGGTPETVVFDDGGGNTEATGTATVGAITSLTSGDYDSLIFLAIDNSDDESHVPTPPSGWGNLTTSSTTSTHALFAYSMDQSAAGVTGFSPGDISFTNQEQWITAHVVVAADSGVTGTASAPLGFTATASGSTAPRATAALGFTATATGTIPFDTIAGVAFAPLGFSAVASGAIDPIPANVGEALWIGDDLGKNHFNIGIGGPGGGTDHDDYDQTLIESGAEPPVQPLKFLLTPDSSAVQFGINVDDGRTSANTNYPRSELRELKEDPSESPNPGDDRAQWDGSTGEHYMVGRSRVTHAAETKPWVVIFQIHDSESDLVRVQTETGGDGPEGLRLRARRTPPGGGSEVTTTLMSSYAIGQWVDWEIRVGGGHAGDTGDNDGRLRIWLDGDLVMDVAGGGATTGCYFKAGCYAQSNTDTENGDDTQFFTVEIEAGSFQAWHTGYATPTTPVFTGSGTGSGGSVGAAFAPIGFGATAVGTITSGEKLGVATAPLGFTATAAGAPVTFGTASSALGFEATAEGPGIEIGDAAASLGFTATVAGTRETPGTATAALGFTGSVTGTVTDALGVPFLMDELGFGASLAVQIAWGADLSADADTWTWTDISADVRNDPGISTKLGRGDEASFSQPASCTMVLDNTDGKYSLGGRSPNWPNVRRSTPVRVRIDPADGSGFRNVFFGFADGFTPGWDSLTGTIPVVTLSASGTLRRLQQGSAPVMSAYRRAMIATDSVVAYWPFEEGKNATRAPAIRGGSDMVSVSEDHEFDSADNFDCSAPLVTLRSGDGTLEDFGASVDPYTDDGEHQVRWLMTIPRDGLPHGCFLMDIFTSGSAARWTVTYSTVGGSGALNFTVWDSNNAVLQETFDIQFAVNGADSRYSVELTQDGPDVVWRLALLGEYETVGGFFTSTVEGETVGSIVSVFVGGNDADGLVVGHVTVQNQITSLFEATGPMRAHTGEFPSSGNESISRLHRVCSENDVKLTRYTGTGFLEDYERMGPQLVAPLLELLRECETASQAQLWDGLDDGLSFTTRFYREFDNLRLTIDAASGELAPPFEPVDDDQGVVNKAEGKILTGITAIFEDTDGPLGTAAIGIYDTTIEASNENDSMAIQYAAWRVHLGTVEGYRFPSVTVNLRAAPHLAPNVLGMVPGDRIDVINVDDTLAGFLNDTVSLLVEGISHEITATTWMVTFQCSPLEPWRIARVAAQSGDTSEFAFRLDTAGCTLDANTSAGATSIDVTTNSGPRWTTNTDDYPLSLDVGGIKVTATACTGSDTTQTFTIDPLPLARSAGVLVKLWKPCPLGL